MKQTFLDWIFRKNKQYFELMLVKDFVGYIPKNVNEPALKCFEEYGEDIEKWVMWQSWYVNKKAINDPPKILFYHGMMVYLKVLSVIAATKKKNRAPIVKTEEPSVEVPFIETALSELSAFQKGMKEIKYEHKENGVNKGSSSKATEAGVNKKSSN